MASLKKTARAAGLMYFALVIMGFYCLLYVPSRIIVDNDAAATTNNLLSKEFLFRTGITVNLVGTVLFLFIAFTLYRLLRQVDEHLAKLMLALVIVQVPIVFIAEALKITALMIAKGELLNSISVVQRQEYAMLFLKTFDYNIMLLEIFWGLWLLPFGLLVYKSVFIPYIFGILLILAGIAYIIEFFANLLFPYYSDLVHRFTFIFYSAGEILTMLWLLIKGVKPIQQCNPPSKHLF